MTDTEINIAIAEACGYYYMDSVWHLPNGAKADRFPDYANDLNAMQSAVMSQSKDFQQDFHTMLLSLSVLPHQATSTQWAEIFIDIALTNAIVQP